MIHSTIISVENGMLKVERIEHDRKFVYFYNPLIFDAALNYFNDDGVLFATPITIINDDAAHS